MFYAVVLGLWLYEAPIWAMMDPVTTIRSDFVLEFLLLVGAGLVMVLWTVAFGRGLVGLGAGAGFRVALLGLAAHVEVTAALAMTGSPGGGTLSHLVPWVAAPIAFTRNASLIAYGLGLALVVLSSSRDWSRRRVGPAHLRFVD